jgi:hypothetical protein
MQTNTTLSLQSITRATQNQSSEGLASWALTVKDSKIFTTLPSYFDDIEIPKNTLKSSLDPVACYTKVIAYFKTNAIRLHPQKALENILTTQSVVYSPPQVVLEDKAVLPIRKGYLLANPSLAPMKVVASAFVASNLSYYVRITKDGKLLDPPKEKITKRLGWNFPDLAGFRLATQNKTRSPIIAQSEIYSAMMKKPHVAIHLMSGILHKMPEYSEKLPDLSGYMTNQYNKEGIPQEARFQPLGPKRKVLRTLAKSINPCADLWKYLYEVRSIRGEDNSGIGALTIPYYYGDMPRTLVKDISMVYDLRAMLNFYKLKHIILPDGIPLYVRRTLVENGFWVICTEEIMYPDYDGTVPGLYRSIGDRVSAIWVKDLHCSRPSVIQKAVEYPSITLDIISNQMIQCKAIKEGRPDYGERIIICKLPLMPLLVKDLDRYSLFPTTSPHNGYVWVSDFREKSYNFDDLISRAISANIYRNNYPTNRVCFWTIDPCRGFFSFQVPLILPKSSAGKKKIIEEDYKFDDLEIKMQSIPADIIPIDLTQFAEEVVAPPTRVADLLKYINQIKSFFPDEKLLKTFLLSQEYKYLNKVDVHFNILRLYENYDNMQTIFELFGFFDYYEAKALSDYPQTSPVVEVAPLVLQQGNVVVVPEDKGDVSQEPDLSSDDEESLFSYNVDDFSTSHNEKQEKSSAPVENK